MKITEHIEVIKKGVTARLRTFEPPNLAPHATYLDDPPPPLPHLHDLMASSTFAWISQLLSLFLEQAKN